MNPRLVISATVIIVLLILFSLAQEMNRRWQIDRQVAKLEQDANALQKQVIELNNLNQYFRTPDFEERIAREKLNYRAPGEQVVLIPEDDQVAQPVPAKLTIPKKPTPLPIVWWNAFFLDSYGTTK